MTTTINSLRPHNNHQKLNLSFEFFPPKNPRMERTLWRTIGQLERFNPQFFSMTYGALGGEREYSLSAVKTMQKECHTPITAHLTAAGHTAGSMCVLAQQFADQGVKGIVALRGDLELLPDGVQSVAEMIELLHSVADFDISVAAYPEIHPKAASLQADLEHLKHKLDAGATRALTQYFFNPDVFLHFRDEAVKLGINPQTLIPGILPIHNFAKVKSFSQRCGTNIPNSLHQLFANTEDGSEQQQKLGRDMIVKLVQDLQAEGIEQFHFYTLNQPNLTFDIVKQLGVSTVSGKILQAA